MSTPRIILASLPHLCQKFSKLADIWQRSDRNSFAQFFWDTAYIIVRTKSKLGCVNLPLLPTLHHQWLPNNSRRLAWWRDRRLISMVENMQIRCLAFEVHSRFAWLVTHIVCRPLCRTIYDLHVVSFLRLFELPFIDRFKTTFCTASTNLRLIIAGVSLVILFFL